MTARRRCRALPVVLIAWLFNAIAPVLAYAAGEPLHDARGDHRVVAACPTTGGVTTHHDGAAAGQHGPHDHAAARAPCASPATPVAPHCPYCLDFAAGAALGTVVASITGDPPRAAPPVATSFSPPSARASLRLAASRAPPASA